MVNIAKKILRLNFDLCKTALNWNKVKPKIGMTDAEIFRVLQDKPFTIGYADFFSKKIEYTHAASFIHSVDEIFLNEIYKFNSDTEKPFILDCGANIGLSVIYFNRLFPDAEIIAFEPDEDIFRSLCRNVKCYAPSANINLKKSAVWIADTMVDFFSEGALAGSSVIDYSNKGNITKVQAVDLKKFLDRKVDFLKLDIEGAENTVFFDIKDYLGNVNLLFLEYHGILNKTQNLDKILHLLTEKGFEYYIRLAGDTMKNPFLKEQIGSFNQQLNIFCYRK